MKKKPIYLILSLLTFTTTLYSQHLFVPTGSAGIGTSSNSFIGLGTSAPGARFHIYGSGAGLNNSLGSIMIGKINGPEISAVQESSDDDVQGLAFRVKSDPTNANANFEAMRISNSGNVGIGLNNPVFKLDIINKLGETDDLFRTRVIDAPDDYFKITNMTGSPGQFIPGLYSRHSSDNRQALYITSAIGSTNDTGTEPIAIFDSRLDNASAGVRPLFAWDSYGVRKMILTASGNLGIGTTPVSSKLHIADGNGGEQLRFSRGTGVVRFAQDMNQDNLYLVNGTASITFMAWKANGNVGIGTQSPDAKLAVKGDIHAQEVKVDLLGSVAPDYVFAPEYNLLPLSEVEAYIKANKHLPEVPSAKQMEEEGLNLKEMNLLLLKKVEELTLHLIELEKEKNKVQNQNDVLTTQVDKLSSDIAEIKALLKK